ncbi:MAG: T9SS type A sorting domain-containing protein [Bacteroidia bacterium]|nr:T9SS type A sorting domain-containing protein [Bacteroidia bacterium]
MNTEDTVFHVVNSEYFPTRATVTDNCSDSTNVSLTVNSNVNPYVVGCYQEYHTAVDSSGNRSLKIRTICVRSSLDLSAKVVSEDALFQVYPNPTSGTFQAQIGLEDREGLEVVVKNMLGETVERFDLVDEQNLIDIGSQPSGMYIVTLRTNGVGYVRKVFLK